MSPKSKFILGAALAAAMIAILGTAAAEASDRAIHVSVGAAARAPIGYVEFCNELPKECAATNSEPRDVVLTSKVWKDLVRVNKWVNDTIAPITDMDHWGLVEKWSYPDDGKGDCEDYVLLKRRMLMQAGWPREALLITVVRDKKGDGHAVLTVKTDKGDFVLDNQEEQVLLWSETGYRFVKRQSLSNPNNWVALGPRPGARAAGVPHRRPQLFGDQPIRFRPLAYCCQRLT
jgi:predicted transglutaminase-like cysteine proteinase